MLVQATDMPHGEIDDELMVLDSKQGEILGLDKIGTDIWRMASSPTSAAIMIERLVQEYDADAGIISDDLMPFLTQLVERGLLRIVD